MATIVPEIRVFTMFPPNPTNPEPFSTWIWVNCLTFPLNTLNKLRFTLKYYKWIRYATGVVIGAQGDISFSQDSPHNVIDYDHELPSTSIDLYYHTNDAEKRRMFPIDPDMAHSNMTSIGTTPRRANFHNDVVARDSVCVLTDFETSDCDAAHLLPHSKGDEYIENYTRHRSRDPAGNDIVSNINDVRNGMLLNILAHNNLGSNIAFLTTPNFAMSTADVDLTAPPTEKRCTAHLFTPDKPAKFGGPVVCSRPPVRMPDTPDKWPPSIVFDAIYGEAVLHYFSPRPMQDILKRWKPVFYPGGITSAAQASYQDERTAKNQRKDEQNRVREDRAAARRANRVGAGDSLDYYDCLMILPYLMVPPEEQESVWRKAAEKRARRSGAAWKKRLWVGQRELRMHYKGRKAKVVTDKEEERPGGRAGLWWFVDWEMPRSISTL